MSAGFNPYKYTTTKEVKNHLKEDLNRMIYSICTVGYVCQEQYERLDSYLCENYVSMIIEILSDETECNIWYAFSKHSCSFVFYDTDKIDNELAKKKADEVQFYLYKR